MTQQRDEPEPTHIGQGKRKSDLARARLASHYIGSTQNQFMRQLIGRGKVTPRRRLMDWWSRIAVSSLSYADG